MRGGWAMERLQTVFNYIISSFKSDSKVGKSLSGWPSSTNDGGKCPYKDCLTVPHEKRLFSSLAARLLSGPLQLRSKEYLLVVLILYYPDVKVLFPRCRLIATMERISSDFGITIDILQSWSETFRHAFKAMNAASLPLSNWREGDMIPVASFADTIHFTQTLLNNTRQISEDNNVRLTIVQRQLDDVPASLQRVEENLKRYMRSVVNEVFAAQRQQNVAWNGNNEVYDHLNGHAGINDNFVEENGDEDEDGEGSADSDEEIVVEHGRIPDALIRPSLAKFTTEKLFQQWYRDRIYSISRDALTLEQLKRKRKFIKCMNWLKRFLPAGTIIKPMPDNPIQQNRWITEIGVHAKTATRGAMEFCRLPAIAMEISEGQRFRSEHSGKRKLREVVDQPNIEGGVADKRRKFTSSFDGMFKKLNAVRTQSFPNPFDVVDECTPIELQNIENFEFQ